MHHCRCAWIMSHKEGNWSWPSAGHSIHSILSKSPVSTDVALISMWMLWDDLVYFSLTLQIILQTEVRVTPHLFKPFVLFLCMNSISSERPRWKVKSTLVVVNNQWKINHRESVRFRTCSAHRAWGFWWSAHILFWVLCVWYKSVLFDSTWIVYLDRAGISIQSLGCWITYHQISCTLW